jgi:hypothetical protein
MRIALFSFLHLTTLSFGQIAPGTTPVVECLQPQGIFSAQNKYAIEPLSQVKNTRLLLTSDSKYFLKAQEELKECTAHWQSEAVEVEIHGDDHDYFTAIILIQNKKFKAKFSWQSDGCETRPAEIVPSSVSLTLSDDDFKKGKKYSGHLKMTTACKGDPCQDVKFNIEGNFIFTIP